MPRDESLGIPEFIKPALGLEEKSNKISFPIPFQKSVFSIWNHFKNLGNSENTSKEQNSELQINRAPTTHYNDSLFRKSNSSRQNSNLQRFSRNNSSEIIPKVNKKFTSSDFSITGKVISRPINSIVESSTNFQPLLNRSLADLSKSYAQQLAKYHRDIVNNKRKRLKNSDIQSESSHSSSNDSNDKNSGDFCIKNNEFKNELMEEMISKQKYIEDETSRKMMKFVNILVHVVPSYYILLSKSPWHLLIYNFSIWSMRWFSTTRHPYLQREWMKIWLCLFAALARVCILWNCKIKKDKFVEIPTYLSTNLVQSDSEEENFKSLNLQKLIRSFYRIYNYLSKYSIILIQTLALIFTIRDTCILLRLRSKLEQSNWLFISILNKNTRIYDTWRDDRVQILKQLRSVRNNSFYRLSLDLISTFTILIVSLIRSFKNKSDTILQVLTIQRGTGIIKNIKEKLKYLKKIGSLFQYISKPIHIVIFEFLYFNCDRILFVHLISLLVQCILFKQSKRLKTPNILQY